MKTYLLTAKETDLRVFRIRANDETQARKIFESTAISDLDELDEIEEQDDFSRTVLCIREEK